MFSLFNYIHNRYITYIYFDQSKKIERIFSFSYPLFIFVHLFIFIIWYQSSNLRALVATFIMTEIVDPLQDFSSPYHVSSQQHMIFSLGTQHKRQIFVDQSKAMINTHMKDDILLKSAVIVERQDIWLIHVIENMVFHLSSSLKIRKHIVIITSKIMKVQCQKHILNKLILLLSNIKHY